jgi:hypothetical protein
MIKRICDGTDESKKDVKEGTTIQHVPTPDGPQTMRGSNTKTPSSFCCCGELEDPNDLNEFPEALRSCSVEEDMGSCVDSENFGVEIVLVRVILLSG